MLVADDVVRQAGSPGGWYRGNTLVARPSRQLAADGLAGEALQNTTDTIMGGGIVGALVPVDGSDGGPDGADGGGRGALLGARALPRSAARSGGAPGRRRQQVGGDARDAS